MKMSKISYDLDDLFSLLICAEVYEFGNDILYKTLIFPMEINNSHIDKYIKENYTEEKFTKEEISQYKTILVELFKIYK